MRFEAYVAEFWRKNFWIHTFHYGEQMGAGTHPVQLYFDVEIRLAHKSSRL